MDWPRAFEIEEVPFSQIAPIPDLKDPGGPPDLNDGIDDLVKSIQKFGLLQPIIVCRLPDGRYQLIAGRRRVLACAILQASFAKAVVLDSIPDPAIANAIWASENLVREEIPAAHLAAAFGTLFTEFGSADNIAAQTGIPLDLVRRYLPR